MAKLVASVYSDALFEVAVEENKSDLFLEELQFVIDTFNKYPEFYELFKTPKINVEEKKQVVTEVFGEKLSTEMLNFLKIVLDKKRGNAMKQINDEFIDKILHHKGIEKATAESAVPLSDDEMTRLKKELSVLTGNEIILSNVINPDVIGGVLLRIGDKVIDGSLKKRLEDMKETLAQIIV